MFEDLAAGDPEPLLRHVEAHIRAEHLERDGECCTWMLSAWYECALQLAFWYALWPVMPAGWNLQQEVRSDDWRRRADLVFTTPDGDRIMIELKYVNIGQLACATADRQYERADECFEALEDAEDILALEFFPHRAKNAERIDEHFRHREFGSSKFGETRDGVGASVAFVVVGVGHRLATLDPK